MLLQVMDSDEDDDGLDHSAPGGGDSNTLQQPLLQRLGLKAPPRWQFWRRGAHHKVLWCSRCNGAV